MSEDILNPGYALTLRPMKYPNFYKLYKTSKDNNWTTEELSFNTDQQDLRNLTLAESNIVKMIVAFFATGDQIVANNLAVVLYKHVNSPEARMFYSRQIYEEANHIEFYKTLLEAYIPDGKEQEMMFKAVETIPSIKAKADWAMKWMDQTSKIDRIETMEDRKNFLMNMLAFACGIEGLFFFAAFAYVYYLRDRNLLHGLASGTNWVFRDESMHMRFAFEVVDVIRDENPGIWDADMENRFRVMLEEAIQCEMQFGDDVLAYDVIGMSKKDMLEYLRYVADGHLRRMGMPPVYNASCPFAFMLKQDVQALTSFFERTVAEYTVGIGGDVDLNVDDF